MKPRQQSFFHTTVDPFYDPSDWLTHYRMSKSTFHEIANAIAPLIQRQHTNYRAAITVCQRLSVTLLYLATGITQQQVASMEGISQSVVQRSVHEVCKAIADTLADEYIKFPHTEDEMKVVAARFQSMKGLPQVIAALDGTHVAIRKPGNSGDSYMNRFENSRVFGILL